MAQARQPRATPELLRLLGVQDASVGHHLVALAEWLKGNTPSPELRLSLRANGYGQLLPHPTGVWRPWTPIPKAG